MGSLRSFLFAPTAFVAASAAWAVPYSAHFSTHCAGLLSGPAHADEAGSPEAALVTAWRSLVGAELSEGPSKELLLRWLQKVAEDGGTDLAAPEAPSIALAEGLDELIRVADALADAGRIDRRRLDRLVSEAAVGILEELGLRRSQADESRASRSALKEPIQRIPLGEAPIMDRPQSLPDGRIVVVAGPQLIFLDPKGLELSRTNLPGSTGTNVVLLPDGEVAIGTEEGEVLWLDLAGRELARVMTPVRKIDRIHSLKDGGIFVESLDREPPAFVTRTGLAKQFSQDLENGELLGELADGRLLLATEDGALNLVPLFGDEGRVSIPIALQFASLSAVPLRDGTIFVKSNKGDFVLLDSNGNRLHRENGGLAGLSRPVELPDGGVVFGSLTDGAVFINADGTIRARTPMRVSVAMRTTVLSNGVVVMGGGGRSLEFFEASGRALGSLMIAPDSFSTFQGVRSQLLEAPSESGSALGFIGLLDGSVLRIDLQAVSALFGFSDAFSPGEVK